MVTKKQYLELIVAVDIYLTPHECNLCMVCYLETRKISGPFPCLARVIRLCYMLESLQLRKRWVAWFPSPEIQ